MFIQNFIKNHWSKILLFIGIVFLLYAVLSLNFLITLDGPAHLYNSQIYNNLLANDSWSLSFFHINNQFTPNYGSLLLISGLLAIFNYVLALKAFHILFVLLFAGGFYFWNKSNSEQRLYVIILPFIFCELFWAGFYNFILAIAFLFFILAFYERTKLVSWKKYGLLTLCFLILYFSHSIVFIFGGLAIFIFEVTAFFKQKNQNFIQRLKPFFYLLIAALPCFLLAFLFMDSRESTIEYLPKQQLILDFFEGKVFRAGSEFSKAVRPLFPILILIITAGILIQRKLKTTSNYLLFTAIACMILYFILPDSVGYASVFSARIIYFFWIFLIAWICRNPPIFTWQKLSINALIFFFLSVQLLSHLAYWRELDKNANLLLEAKNYIPEKSIVYPVFTSNHWDELHISNLLGLEKDIVVLENTVARSDYFVVQYNEPYEKYISQFQHLTFPTLTDSISINYIVKIGKGEPDLANDIALFNEIKTNGKIIFQNEMVEVWSRK